MWNEILIKITALKSTRVHLYTENYGISMTSKGVAKRYKICQNKSIFAENAKKVFKRTNTRKC